jgi:hypothetical protein
VTDDIRDPDPDEPVDAPEAPEPPFPDNDPVPDDEATLEESLA